MKEFTQEQQEYIQKFLKEIAKEAGITVEEMMDSFVRLSRG